MLKFGKGNEAIPESRVSTGLKWLTIGSGIAFGTLCVRDYMRCQNSAAEKTCDISPSDIDAASDLPDRLLANET